MSPLGISQEKLLKANPVLHSLRNAQVGALLLLG